MHFGCLASGASLFVDNRIDHTMRCGREVMRSPGKRWPSRERRGGSIPFISETRGRGGMVDADVAQLGKRTNPLVRSERVVNSLPLSRRVCPCRFESCRPHIPT